MKTEDIRRYKAVEERAKSYVPNNRYEAGFRAEFVGFYNGTKHKGYHGYPVYRVETPDKTGYCVERDFQYLVWIPEYLENEILRHLVRSFNE